MIFALVIALPLFIWAIVNLNFNPFRKAASGEPLPTPTSTGSSYIINELFDGQNLDSSRWGWTGSAGSQVSIENGRLKAEVLSGNDTMGGNDVTVQNLNNGAAPIITDDFEVIVDLGGVTSGYGYQDLRFSPNGFISIRRVKNGGTTESLEIWTSPDGSPKSSTRTVYRSLPSQSNPLRIKLARKGAEVLAYYLENGTYVNFYNVAYQPLSGNGNPPKMGVENMWSSYPATAGYFDNYYGSFTLARQEPAPTPVPSSTPTPKPSSVCPGAEACPASDGYTLRNCTPPEADGTPQESLCSWKGRIESCGGQQYCCPGVGAAWTTNLVLCGATPSPLPPTPPPATTIPTPVPTAPLCVNSCGNGICESVVCLGTGCPCAESPTSCPDCVPTPQPTPIAQNSIPVIQTRLISPIAFVGRSYRTTLTASDKDVRDILVPTITGLPFGLTYECTGSRPAGAATSTGQRLSCIIYGTPTASGNYNITFTVSDQRPGGRVSRSYRIFVTRLPGIFGIGRK